MDIRAFTTSLLLFLFFCVEVTSQEADRPSHSCILHILTKCRSDNTNCWDVDVNSGPYSTPFPEGCGRRGGSSQTITVTHPSVSSGLVEHEKTGETESNAGDYVESYQQADYTGGSSEIDASENKQNLAVNTGDNALGTNTQDDTEESMNDSERSPRSDESDVIRLELTNNFNFHFYPKQGSAGRQEATGGAGGGRSMVGSKPAIDAGGLKSGEKLGGKK